MIMKYHSLSCVCFDCLMEDTQLSPEYGGFTAFPIMEIEVITK